MALKFSLGSHFNNLDKDAEQQLEPYKIIPNFISKAVRTYLNQLSLSNQPILPRAKEGFAAVVMVDVSGYSTLTSVLAERGPLGAELLSKTMKEFLDKVIHVITMHQGDIVKFVGDAVIFYWRMPDSPTTTTTTNGATTTYNATDNASLVEDEDMTGTDNCTDPTMNLARGKIVLKACECCLELLNQLGDYEINIPDCPIKKLRIHLGIGAGQVFDVFVGGTSTDQIAGNVNRQRWEHFIAGDAVSQIGLVLDLAKAGELALSHQALKYFGHVVDISSVELGSYDKRCIILNGLESKRLKIDLNDQLHQLDQLHLPLSDTQLEENSKYYRQFVNQNALFKLEKDIRHGRMFNQGNLTELLDLHELRQVTTLFIKVGHLKFHSIREFTTAQLAMSLVQKSLHKYEGSLRQFHVDDKGAILLAFFGLPPLAHEKDPCYAVRAALEISQGFLLHFDNFAMGVTTGVVSIGGVGKAVRTEYAVMGDSINMAARLMCMDEARGWVVCDEKTYKLCMDQFHFEYVGHKKVKGRSTPLQVFKPVGALISNARSGVGVRPYDLHGQVVVGRYKEKGVIGMALKLLEEVGGERVGVGGVLVVEGDKGQGVTTLSQFTLVEAQKCEFVVSVGIADEMEYGSPFFVFQDITRALLAALQDARHADGTLAKSNSVSNDSVTTNDEKLKGNGEARLSIADRIRDIYALLDKNPSFTLYFMPSFSLRDLQDMDPFKDKAKTIKIYLQMVACLSEIKKLVLIFRECQWMDADSWQLALEISKNCPKVLLCFFSRPERHFTNSLTQQIYVETKKAKHVAILSGLSREESKVYILKLWNMSTAKSLQVRILDDIWRRSGGYPLFIKSLALQIKESDQWRIAPDGQIQLKSYHYDLDKILPDLTLQHSIVAQFDRLDQKLQLVLKVGSVVGEQFLLDDVIHFLPTVEWGETAAGVASSTESATLNEKSASARVKATIAKSIADMDKFGFLIPLDNSNQKNYLYAFKNSVFRKCVYGMIMFSQRQRLHTLVAVFYEQMFKKYNDNNLLVPIYEHYRETDEANEYRKLLYLSLVSRFYYEGRFMNRAIVHFSKLLFQFAAMKTSMVDNWTISNWQRELGGAYLLTCHLEEAEIHLLESLSFIDFHLPTVGLKGQLYRFWNGYMRRRNAAIPKFFAENQIEKASKSLAAHSQAFYSSQMIQSTGQMIVSITKKSSSSGNSKLLMLPSTPAGASYCRAFGSKEDVLLLIRSVLVDLCCNFMLRDKIKELNDFANSALASNEKAEDGMQAQVYSFLGYAYFLSHDKRELGLSLLQKAKQTLEKEIQLQSIDKIVYYDCHASTFFILGQWKISEQEQDWLIQLALSVGDFAHWERATRMKSISLFHRSRARESFELAKTMSDRALTEDYWVANYWGTILNLNASLLFQDEKGEIELQMENLKNWYDVSLEGLKSKEVSMHHFNYFCLSLECNLTLGISDDVIAKNVSLLSLIRNFELKDWPFAIGLYSLARVYMTYSRSGLPKQHTNRVIKSSRAVCNAIAALLKKVKLYNLAQPFHHLFKAIGYLIGGKSNKAVAQATKGLAFPVNLHEGVSYIQTLLGELKVQR